MVIRDYATIVKGRNIGDVFLFALSTCVWCMKTKKLLNNLGIEYSYIDVDLVEYDIKDEVVKELNRWNPSESFPTIVINNKKRIIGYNVDEIEELGKCTRRK
ncbi:MAG: glutaredoxin family protein [Candidatus Methylarchaceae archaeon HK02M1]|nr:glutaredoxin family protein [Candidatus Methylarchaceae archaeon HK02M1]